MDLDLFDIFLGCLVIWGIYRIVKTVLAHAVANMVANSIPVEAVFPIRLEHTSDQWYAWDYDDEFIGQATTKDMLIDKLALEMDFPKDQFKIISDYPVGTKKENIL